MDTKKAAELLEQVLESDSYSQKLLVDLQHIHRIKKIGPYEYNRLVNILSCQMLLIEDVRKKITNYITEETTRKLKFDVRI